LSAEQQAALQQAEQLNQQVMQLYQQGKHAEATPLAEQALAIRKRILGDRHLDVATSLNNLAALYDDQGRYAEAEPLYQRSLQIRETQLGKNHPDVATSLNNLAVLYESRGDAGRALSFLTQGMQIEEQNLGTNLVLGSEQQKRDYIAQLTGTTYRAISLHLRAATNPPDAAPLALTAILQRKGRILDALTDNLNRLRQNLTPDLQAKLDQLANFRSQQSALFYSNLSTTTPDQYRANLQTLQRQTTELEAELNRRGAEFRSETQPITLEAVQAQIPADAALVELVLY
jgi:tetratricopeptide (TPR) repeat protein